MIPAVNETVGPLGSRHRSVGSGTYLAVTGLLEWMVVTAPPPLWRSKGAIGRMER